MFKKNEITQFQRTFKPLHVNLYSTFKTKIIYNHELLVSSWLENCQYYSSTVVIYDCRAVIKISNIVLKRPFKQCDWKFVYANLFAARATKPKCGKGRFIRCDFYNVSESLFKIFIKAFKFIVLGIKHGEEKPNEKQTKSRRKSTDRYSLILFKCEYSIAVISVVRK